MEGTLKMIPDHINILSPLFYPLPIIQYLSPIDGTAVSWHLNKDQITNQYPNLKSIQIILEIWDQVKFKVNYNFINIYADYKVLEWKDQQPL